MSANYSSIYGHVTYYMSTFKFYHTVSDQVLAVFHPISASAVSIV